MKKFIFLLIIVFIAGLITAFYPFDTGMHMGMSTGGGTGGSFPGTIFAFVDTGGIAFKDTGGITFKDY